MKIKKKIATLVAAVAVASTFAVNASAATSTTNLNVGGYIGTGTSITYGTSARGTSYVQAPTYVSSTSGVFSYYYSYNYTEKVTAPTQKAGSGTIYNGTATIGFSALAGYTTTRLESGHSWTCNGGSNSGSTTANY